MQILWRNVIAFFLAIFALFFLIKFQSGLSSAVDSLGRIGPGNSRDDQTSGLIALGLIGAVLVAIVKILTQGKK